MLVWSDNEDLLDLESPDNLKLKIFRLVRRTNIKTSPQNSPFFNPVDKKYTADSEEKIPLGVKLFLYV